MIGKIRPLLLIVSLVVTGVVSQPLEGVAAADVEPTPFCQSLVASGQSTGAPISVSPEIAPLLANVKWATLTPSDAWTLASQVFRLSGSLPAALVADGQSQAVLKHYVETIWGQGRNGIYLVHTFGAADHPRRAMRTSTKESASEALFRFLMVLNISFHDTFHYLQTERCNSLRIASIDLTELNARVGTSPDPEELLKASDLLMSSKSNTGLVVLPISVDAYLTGSSGYFHQGPRLEVVLRQAEEAIAKGAVGPCRTEMQHISGTYFSLKRYPLPPNYYDPISIQGYLREAQAWILTADLAGRLEDNLISPLKGLGFRDHVSAGTFLIYFSLILENLRSVPGAWDALRADGTDHSLLWMMNVLARSWRHRKNRGAEDYSCGQLIFGSRVQTLRDFVSTAGVPEEPSEWAGRYLQIAAKPECIRGQQCTMKLSLTSPAKLASVDIGTPGLKFDRKSMSIRGKPSRRGWSGVSVRVRVKGREFVANVNVTTK